MRNGLTPQVGAENQVLPPGQGEETGSVNKKHPKIIRRRHPVKVMYMGVVAPPTRNKDFDGKIFFKR
eukprot:13068309-Ditylum_brightwellii.AAC.2